MRAMELWVARHGETEWTIAKRHTGRTNISLTSAGEDEARALARKLADVAFGAVLCSPLERARETARLAGFPDPELDERLLEIDYGEHEGVTTAEIRKTHADWVVWTGGNPGGESVEDVGARMDGLTADLRGRDVDRALVFGHGHALRILTARWLGLAAREGRVVLLAPATLGVLGEEHGHAAIARWSV